MEAFLNIFAPIAFTIFVVGLGLRIGRWFKALFTQRKVRGRNAGFPEVSQPMSLLGGAKDVLFGPVKNFTGRSNRTWNRGYVLYHIAIITEVTGYTLSALILFGRMAMGQMVPDVATHAEQSFNFAPANLLAIIFGNGEHLQAHFLFGDFASIFIGITWVAVTFAVLGNLHLMYSLWTRRNSAAVVSDIDDAAKGVRIKGRLTWDRIAVRSLIFLIIWTELFARLNLIPGIVFVHSALGLALFTLFPFTYLYHMVYNFIALFYSARRRASRVVA